MPCAASHVSRLVGLVAAAVLIEIDCIGDVERGLPVLDGTGTSVGDIPCAQLAQSLDRRVRPSVPSHWLKSRFMPYFRTVVHCVSLPRISVAPAAEVPVDDRLRRIGSTMLGNVCGIDDDRALLFEDLDRFGHGFGLRGVQTAARLFRAG